MYSNLKPQKSLGSWRTSSSCHGNNLLDELNAVENPCKSLKFVILGAGIAGLSAAYELEKRGHTCVILEAESSHVGGRVRTLRFGDGLHGEAGAMRIPEVHHLTRHYIKDPKISAKAVVMLASYTWGDFARRLGNLSLKKRHHVVQKALEQLHPQFKSEGMLRSMVSWNWDDHKWSGGAYSFFMPGQHSALHQHIIAPEGRIFFAGEHASLDHSWIQGALESSLRPVKSMLIAAQ